MERSKQDLQESDDVDEAGAAREDRQQKNDPGQLDWLLPLRSTLGSYTCLARS